MCSMLTLYLLAPGDNCSDIDPKKCQHNLIFFISRAVLAQGPISSLNAVTTHDSYEADTKQEKTLANQKNRYLFHTKRRRPPSYTKGAAKAKVDSL